MQHGATQSFLPHVPKLEYVLRGAKVERAKMQQGTKRVPITPVILRNKQTLVLLWLPEITVSWVNVVWLPEINSPWISRLQGTQLSVFNVSQSMHQRAPAGALPLHQDKNLKTEGVSVYLDRTGNTLCPVVEMLAYLAARRSQALLLNRYILRHV